MDGSTGVVVVAVLAVIVTAPLFFGAGVWYGKVALPRLMDRGMGALGMTLPTAVSVVLLLTAASVFR